MVTVGAIIGWLNANSGMLSAIATVALTAFAAVELWRGRKVTARANAEVGAHAFALRRQLNSIIEETHLWTQASELRREARQIAEAHYDEAEARALTMVTAAGGADDRYAAAAREAYMLFYQAADQINAASRGAAHPAPRNDRPPEFDHLDDAMSTLEQCVQVLGRAIPHELASQELRFSPARGFGSRLRAAWERSRGAVKGGSSGS